MTDERLGAAIGRLEVALDRVERASVARPIAGGGDRLGERHERLRARTQEAIDALDRLIESG